MSHATSTPQIRIGIYDSGPHYDRYAVPHGSPPSSFSPSSSVPMPIPNARESPPPPLPPPRYISGLSNGQDPGYEWANSPNGENFGRVYGTVKPGSSLLGGAVANNPLRQDKSPVLDERDSVGSRRESAYSPSTTHSDMSTDQHDERRGSQSRPTAVDHRLQSEKQLGQKSLENSSQAYDKQLLSKIGGPNTPTRVQAPGLLAPQEAAPNATSSLSKLNGQLKPLATMPDRLQTSVDSSASRWPTSGAVSPAHSGFKSPIFDSASSDSMSSRMFGLTTGEDTGSASHSHRGSYDQGIFMDNDFGMDERDMRDLHIHDRSPGAEYDPNMKSGLKRRASSPPKEAARDDRPTGGKDLYHRRSQQMLVNRTSPQPAPRFQQNAGSISSVSSISQRTGSYASSYNLSVASSATSYSDRLSPGALSPAESDVGPVSPHAGNPRSHNPSNSRAAISRPSQHHIAPELEHPQPRKLSVDSLAHSRNNSVSKMTGLFICECCPKKPKKFESEEELRVHELEKQYTCAFCPNRFKNKNEAERHQNSLHLRKHSWSCAALAGPHAAFHLSTNCTASPGSVDVCGYCGKEFDNPPNWDVRNDHLNRTHKFGECNQAKKFYRADHFRQHLKHSHAGSSGKWTNMLESACQRDEAPPPNMRALPPQGPHPTPFETAGHPGASTLQPPIIINEAHDD